jgi:hypothetical protein
MEIVKGKWLVFIVNEAGERTLHGEYDSESEAFDIAEGLTIPEGSDAFVGQMF